MRFEILSRRSCVPALSLAIALSWSMTTVAGNWPSWRGPGLDGTAADGQYPVEWSAEKNIAWSLEMGGKSGSTPVVWGDLVILTTPIDGKNGVVALNREGKEQWRVTIGEEDPGKHRKASGTNPSPVTDGERIFAYFKSGDFAALDMQGKILWHQNLQEKYGEDTLWWDLGTSPVLTSEHVVVACMQTGPSYIAAFDKLTGKEVWKTDRETGAPEEAAQSYSTPIVTMYEGQEQIVTLGADFVTCHDAKTGKELWRVGTLNPGQERFFRSIASPVITNGIVIAPYSRGQTLTAIRMGGSGDVTKSHVLWTKDVSADVPTPTAEDGKVYVCTDKGTVACLDAESGEEVWSVMLEKNRNAYSSSPVLANGLLYLTREDGKTFVLDTKRKSVVSTNTVHEDTFTVSTPVLVDNSILLRTFDRLYCIK
ncbi:MAG: PQQ-binding-like beta-propeller repeat protein [Planctomycetaceae bacterium]|nr:PQQ-binding-like beta-propeller repeat protein [Planctomycetaceae bacterium]